MVEAWPKLFGESFEDRRSHVDVLVILHCFTSAEREKFLVKWNKEYLGHHRHVYASDRLDVAAGIVGFPDDPGTMKVDFKVNGNKYLGAHRPLVAILFANDTWGGTFNWIMQGDDDTKFALGRDLQALSATTTPRETPVLAGRIGPKHGDVAPKCYPSDERTEPKIDCCTDLAPPRAGSEEGLFFLVLSFDASSVSEERRAIADGRSSNRAPSSTVRV